MPSIAALVVEVIAIVMGIGAIRTKRMQIKRPSHYADGRIAGDEYITGTSAVVAGLVCILLGIVLIAFGVLANLGLVF